MEKRKMNNQLMVFLGTQDVWENSDPGDEWIHVKTPAQAIALLETGEVSDLSLEHELDCDKSDGTGIDVLEWIEEQVFLSERGNYYSGLGLLGKTPRNFFAPPKTITAYSDDKDVQKEMNAKIEKIKQVK